MRVTKREVSGVTVLAFEGKIAIGAGDRVLREAVQEALADGARRLILDMTLVKTIDSSGIGELVSAAMTIGNRNGQMKLVSLPPQARDILRTTQLYTVFDVFEDEAAALASFGPG